MVAVLGNAGHQLVACCIAGKEAAGASLDLGLVACSCLVWDHSFPLAVPGSWSSDSALAYSVRMARSNYSRPSTHDYLKAYSWNYLSY